MWTEVTSAPTVCVTVPPLQLRKEAQFSEVSLTSDKLECIFEQNKGL